MSGRLSPQSPVSSLMPSLPLKILQLVTLSNLIPTPLINGRLGKDLTSLTTEWLTSSVPNSSQRKQFTELSKNHLKVSKRLLARKSTKELSISFNLNIKIVLVLVRGLLNMDNQLNY